MNPDKLWIGAAVLMIALFGWNMDRIGKEFQLVKEVHEANIDRNLSLAYFYPLSQEERLSVLETLNEQLRGLQDKISESIAIKYFVDLRDAIITLQEQIIDQRDGLLENLDLISFSTLKMHSVLASPELDREQLLQLALLIDQTFPEEESLGLFSIGYDNQQLVVEITPLEGFNSSAVDRFGKFSEDISREIFHNEPVTIRLSPSEEDGGLSFDIQFTRTH